MRVNTSGNEKTRVSILFCANADGRKLKPIILVPRVKPLKDYSPPENVIVCYQKGNTFNENVICDSFIKRCLLPDILARNVKSATVVLDHAPCHQTLMVRNTFKDNNIKTIMVPKRMTALLQPADVSWMRPLKLRFKEKWQEWLINEPKSLTASGNWRSPGYARAINWISEIWADFNEEIIRHSFDACGITQSNYRQCHSQLVAFMDRGLTETVVQEDGADEIRGFDDQSGDRRTDLSDESGDTDECDESESESDDIVP